MSSPIIRGASGVHLHHTTGRLQVADTTTRTIVRQGRYADLKGQVPDRGSPFEGGTVVSADLQPSKGGMALLSVTVRDSASSRYVDNDGDREIIYEVEMAQLEKPLLSHPDFKAYAGPVDNWRCASPVLRASFKYEDADGEHELYGAGLDAAKLIMKGVESYLVFAPVLRRTTCSPKKPRSAFKGVGGLCGKVVTPPAKLRGMASGKWEWLKTADRARTASGGGSERVEEWTGADEWDKALYKEGGADP